MEPEKSTAERPPVAAPSGAALSRRAAGGAALGLALLLYVGIATHSLTEPGVVGEVAAAWGAPPSVLLAVEPAQRSHPVAGPGVGAAMGPLRWSPTRPTLTLAGWPVQVNAYTGGLPDWPTRAAVAGFGLGGARAAHLLWGCALIVGVWRLGGRVGGPLVGALAALLLATRWDFAVWRAMLGGTELALLTAGLGLLAGLLPGAAAGRRARAVGVGAALALGLHAKITFALVAAPLLLAALGGAPRLGARRSLCLALPVAALGLLPAALAALAARGLDPAAPAIRSHDSLGLQGARVWALLSGAGGAREQLSNLGRWLGDPSAFLVQAWGADPGALPGPAAGLLLGVGWALALIGAVVGWRAGGSLGAASRLLSVALPAQVLLLLIFARDLHHLGQAAAITALWMAVGIASLARRVAGGRAWLVVAVALGLALPGLVGGPLALRAFDPLLRSAPAPTLSASGQRALVKLIAENNVQRVVLCDYEASGALELLLPGVRFDNAWGAASRGEPGLVEALLRAAVGAHLLVLRASGPFIYNRAPSPGQLQGVAAANGLEVERVGGLEGGRAALYRVRAKAR